ncbi:MAG TPA: DUF2249 domain-containing protein [Kofleriaceae bacterium]|nr:DUF2249 domain-containing protein [Kofleriaceae bacterium]
MIRAEDRVAAVLAQDERLLDVFVAASSAFEKLRSPALRKTMAKLVTVEQAARIAGVDPALLLDRLNAALGGTAPTEGATWTPAADASPLPPIPDAWRALPAERIVDVDVREDLRAGKEPFRRILDAARALPRGSVLRVRAIFEPAPLYGVLAKHGLGHATEQLGPEDWRVWFHHDDAATAPEPREIASDMPADGDVIVIDVRGLEPPEPMVRTLEALAEMPRGKTLVQINVRVPQYLLPKLAERGFTYEVREQGPDLVRLFVRHREP